MPGQTDTFLDRILADKRQELERRQQKEPVEVLQRRVAELSSQWSRGDQWSLVQAIMEGPRGPHAGGKRIQLIAEVKKASPSKGRLVSVLEHRALGRTYTIFGAAGISVVTEEKHFQGSLQFLYDLRVSLDGYYPGGRPSLLRKDFLFDPYHLWEARAYGADAVLLIAAILSRDEMASLMAQAGEMEMECLVEVHDERDLQRFLLLSTLQLLALVGQDTVQEGLSHAAVRFSRCTLRSRSPSKSSLASRTSIPTTCSPGPMLTATRSLRRTTSHWTSPSTRRM